MLSSVGAPNPGQDKQDKALRATHPKPLGNNKGLECSSLHTGGFLSLTGPIMGRAVIRAGSAPRGHSSSVPSDTIHFTLLSNWICGDGTMGLYGRSQ